MTLQCLIAAVFFAVAGWAGGVAAQVPLTTAATIAQNTTSIAVAIDGAWARASVAGQKATGAFMRITARQSLRLVGTDSPAAGVTELHEMKMEGDVMKMRAVPALALPAGQTVELKPGGYHVMLMDLKAPLTPGSSVPLTLVFQDAQGFEFRQQVQVPVATRAVPTAHAPAHQH
jgi:copper(I)-binding protein